MSKFKKEILDEDAKIVINCRTLESAKELLAIAHEQGLKWSSGELYSKFFTWDYKEDTCYNIKKGIIAGIGHYVDRNYTILEYPRDKDKIFEQKDKVIEVSNISDIMNCILQTGEYCNTEWSIYENKNWFALSKQNGFNTCFGFHELNEAVTIINKHNIINGVKLKAKPRKSKEEIIREAIDEIEEYGRYRNKKDRVVYCIQFLDRDKDFKFTVGHHKVADSLSSIYFTKEDAMNIVDKLNKELGVE